MRTAWYCFSLNVVLVSLYKNKIQMYIYIKKEMLISRANKTLQSERLSGDLLKVRGYSWPGGLPVQCYTLGLTIQGRKIV